MTRKLARLCALALSLLFCFSLTGCDKKPSEAAKTDAAEAFLNEFFRFNHQERYKIVSNPAAADGPDGTGEGPVPLSERQRQAYEAYYLPYADLATPVCIAAMRANRLPLKYDKLAAQEGVSAQVGGIRCETLDETTFAFEVSFDGSGTAEWLQSPVNGRLTMEIVDGRPLVSSISIH